MPTLTAVYLEDFSRVELEAGDLDPEVVYSIQRSTDGGTTWVPVRGASNITDGGVTIVYDYEFAPNVENLYELVAPAVSDTFERDTGPGGLVLTGASGSYASTPDTAALDITGDIDLRGVIALPDYSTGAEQTIVAKYGTTTNQRSYQARVTATGYLQGVFSTDGTAIFNSISTISLYDAGKSDGDLIAWRITRVAATGVVTFYLGNDPVILPDTWEPMGATVAGTTGNLFSGTAPLEVGSANSGALTRATGTIVTVRVLNGINGTTAAYPRFAQNATGTGSFADSTGKTWTVNGTASILGNDQAWGSTDSGQPWNLHVDSSTDGIWEVRSGAGRLLVDDSAFGLYGRYVNVNLDDIDARMDFYMPDINQTANDDAEIRMLLRGTNDLSDGYQVRVYIQATPRSATITITGAGTAATVTLPTWQPGQRWRIRARTVGTVIEARAWNTVNPEPNTWHVTASSVAWASGTVGLAFSALANDSIDVLFDNFLVTDVPAAAAAEASVTPVQDDVWLKSIAYPSLNINIGCPLTGPMTRRARNGIFDVKGTPLPVGIEDVGSTEATTLTFMTYSMEQNRAVTALLTFGSPLLLQSPPDADTTGCANAALTPSGWYARGDSVQSRPLVGKRAWMWVVPLVRVAAPSSLILPAHMTWDVLWQMVNTWAELWDEWSTWAELWGATVAPDTVYDALMGES
jgi:hypothetical protein